VERTDAYARRRRRPPRRAGIAVVLCRCAGSLAAGYGAHSLVPGGRDAAATDLGPRAVRVTPAGRIALP